MLLLLLFSKVADLRVEDTNKWEKVTPEPPPPTDMWVHLGLSLQKVVICWCTKQGKKKVVGCFKGLTEIKLHNLPKTTGSPLTNTGTVGCLSSHLR